MLAAILNNTPMTRSSTLISILSILILGGCHGTKTYEELAEMFFQNKPTLDSLITKLKGDKKLDSLFRIGPYNGLPDIKDSYANEYNILKKVGITDASSHMCNKVTNWYSRKTNWPSKYPIFLVYTPCDSLKTIKTFTTKTNIQMSGGG